MNLNDLISKLRTIEEGNEVAPVHTDSPDADGGVEQEGIEIIGGPMGSMGGMLGGMGHSSPPPQQDSVSMNVSLNGAGAQGVRDLMDILHNIEAGADHGNKHDRQEPIMGDMINAMAHEEQVGEEFDADDGETWANSSHGDSGHHTHGIDSVITTGNDMLSKGGERAKVNGGGNPMQEALISRLSQLYNEIKEGAKYRDPKYKDKLYTQEPRDPHDDYHDDDYYNPKPDDYPGAKHVIGGGEFDHDDPLRKGYGRHGTGSMNTHGKRKGMPSRDHISSLKGSIKAAHGTHPRPNLPK
jgi:hypothetical protein